ncbi:hypothetical protein GGF48_002076 [Coemansia sp. RSA 921]|nr:hypothetical protein LPJ58_004178 [Coemansia sp. RSA 1591]KAJ2130278.1 hypothetical protein GGF48_002076 [Coemansia sp. RSA 921]KAJ2166453.1 hypothetical protein GGH15_002746 [Coemansia sp. RSA 562]KAJ2185795.1 hypothetical protein EV181_003677 [Coemansia sp. RSA 532]KAJ2206250.1 hypothetical protein IW145_002269 [Coemansia sp. RSA 521]KAJ2225801.1 hypothetical protein EV180_003232 [Coemansia sp. RSA 518]KAJ2274298.1 hypothetical protein GGH14_004140 [Coemansia sp. RSA 370]KAJ2442374.1 hy
MPNPLEEWYMQLPLFTRIYTTGIVVLTLAIQLEWASPLTLFYTYHAVFVQNEYWRLLTTFLFLGTFSLDWILNIYFIVRYCRDLEEGSYLNRPADFAWTVLLMCTTLLVISPYLGTVFLGDLLVSSLTYMWSRHYSYLFINFMGLFTTSAAYLPWVLVAFSSVVENRWPVVDLAAIGVGHVFWFLAEEWPRRAESGGVRVLRAPRVLCKIMHQDLDDELDQDAEQEPAVAVDGDIAEPTVGSELPSAEPPVQHETTTNPVHHETTTSEKHSNSDESTNQDFASTSAVEHTDPSSTLHQRTPYSHTLAEHD